MLNATHCSSFSQMPIPKRQHFLMSLGQQLINGLRNGLRHLDNKSKLQVQQHRDRAGELYWLAYNPRTGKTFASASEAEMRDWIEQQYQI